MGKASKWFGPLSGLVFVILFVVGAGVSGDADVEPSVSASTALAELADNADQTKLGAYIFLLGLGFFLFFVAYLGDHLRSNGGGWWGTAFFGGGVALTAGLIAMTLLELGGAVAAENGDAETAKMVVDFLWELSVTWTAPLLVMGVAAAVVILGQRALPQWLGWFAVVVALGALMPWIGLFVFGLWVLVVSIVQLLAARRPEPSAG
jgi:hypothetical protein